jgi:hypothetical protein
VCVRVCEKEKRKSECEERKQRHFPSTPIFDNTNTYEASTSSSRSTSYIYIIP